MCQLPSTLAENLYFEGEWVRKRALGFQGKISKLAYLARHGLSLLAVGALASSLLFAGKYLREHDILDLDLIRSTWLERLLQWLPAYRPSVWIAIAVAAFYLSRKLVHMRHYVEEKDYDRPSS